MYFDIYSRPFLSQEFYMEEWTGQEWTGQEWTGQEWTGQEWNGLFCPRNFIRGVSRGKIFRCFRDDLIF